MEKAQKTCNLCILTVVAFGLNILSTYIDASYLINVSVVLSTIIVIAGILSKDRGKYIRWFLIAVNGLYVFFFGIIMFMAQLLKS